MAVEVARLGRKRFENVGGVDSAEVEHSVRRRSIILIMQPVGSCSSDDRGCHHCQTQCDRSIHCVFPLAFCETFQYVGADGCRYTKPSSTFRSSFVPADGTGAASYESGDFDTSPFFGQPSGEPRPASTFLSVVPRAKHNGAARIYCAIDVVVVVLATSMMTV